MNEQAFLNEILTNPQDDAPRLVYADWLEERGDPRGQFIRLQCEAERLPASFDRDDLLYEAKLLRREYGKKWDREVRKQVGRFEYRRGFIEHVSMKVGKFVEKADQFLNLAPIHSAKLRMDRDRVGDLASCPSLRRLERLSLNSVGMAAKRAPEFFGSEHFSQLTHLDLGNNNLGKKGIQVLVERARFDQLCGLCVDGNNLQDQGVEILMQWSALEQVRSLKLSSNHMGRGGLVALAACPYLKSLKELRLDCNRGAPVDALAGFNWPNLKSLYLDQIELGDDGVAALADLPLLESLEHVSLSTNRITDAGAAALAQTKRLKSLKSINVSGNNITQAGFDQLMRSKWFPQLHENCFRTVDLVSILMLMDSPILERTGRLDFRGTRLSTSDLDLIITHPGFANVRQLLLGGYQSPRIGDAGVDALAACPMAHRLEALDLQSNSLSGAAVTAILASPHLKSLKRLDLSSNQLTDESMQTLVESDFAKQLVELDLRDNQGDENASWWKRYKARWDREPKWVERLLFNYQFIGP